MNIIMIITLVVTNAITNMILLEFFSAKYKRKYGGYFIFIFFSLAVFTTVIVNLFHNPTWNLIIYMVIFILLNYIGFEIERPKDILVNLCFFLVIFLLLDTVCYIFIEIILQLGGVVDTFLETNMKMISASLMQYSLYNLLKNYFLQKEIHALSKKDIITYGIISLLCLMTTYLFTLFSNDVSGGVKIFFFAISVIIVILNIWYIKTLESLSQKYELQKSVFIMQENSKMVLRHYQQLEGKEKETRLVLHDIKNHLQVLELELKHSDYLEEIKMKINHLVSEVIIERRILNILFLEKIEELKKDDIRIIFDIDSIDTNFISDFDIVTIFSNILNNAVDAVKELEKEKRAIEVNIKKGEGVLLIYVMNPCANMIKKKGGRIVTTKRGHTGLGLQSMQQVLKKYDANMVIEIDEQSIFTNTIMFII